MSNLQQIEQRHHSDVWRDIIFLAGATLLVALSLGSVTSRAVGSVREREWTVTVTSSVLEVGR